MTTLYDDQLGLGQPQSEPLTSEIMQTPSSGIGIAAPAVPARRTNSDELRDEYSKMSRSEEIFTRIGEFGAGVTGTASPMQARVEASRKKKLSDLAELKESTAALEHGISMIQGVEGSERDSFVDTYAKRLDGISPGLGETYRALSKKPDLLTQFKDYAQYLPEPMQVMMKSNPKEFIKFAGTAEGMKALTDAKDRSDLRVATKKVQTTMLGLQQYVPKEKLDSIMADGVVTASDVMSVQQYLPKELQLSETQLQAVQRNDKVFWQGLGVLHGEKEQEVLANRAKTADKSAQPPTKEIDGKVYQWDPQNKLTGTRLATDSRYVALGAGGQPSAGGLPKDVVDREMRVSDDYRQDTKKFAERRPLFESATDYYANRKDNKTSAGDASLAFAYAKSRDPNDRLAVSETRDLVKLGNLPERFVASVTALAEKGDTLPDRVAKEMYEEIRRKFIEENKAQAKIEAEYTKKVKAYGGEPSRVVRPLAIADLERRGSPANSGSPANAGGEERKVVGNITYVKKNGQWFEERK